MWEDEFAPAIDGQGGGIGTALIKSLRAAFGDSIEIIALGTKAIASVQMLKAGTNKSASEENAICQTVAGADCIVGPSPSVGPTACSGKSRLAWRRR
jgi:hypothetical protein